MTTEMEFENGDHVRGKSGGSEVLTVVETRSDGIYRVQLGKDAGTMRYIKGSELELVAKAEKPKIEPGFYPGRSIMD